MGRVKGACETHVASLVTCSFWLMSNLACHYTMLFQPFDFANTHRNVRDKPAEISAHKEWRRHRPKQRHFVASRSFDMRKHFPPESNGIDDILPRPSFSSSSNGFLVAVCYRIINHDRIHCIRTCNSHRLRANIKQPITNPIKFRHSQCHELPLHPSV